MYPAFGFVGLISSVISAGLEELDAAMPYVRRKRIAEQDGGDDPV